MGASNVVLTIPEPNKFELVERPYPKIKAGYLIVRNEYAGVCLEGTRIWAKHDFEKFYGGGQSDYPDGLGHESVGVVEDVMPGSNFRKGDRVGLYKIIRDYSPSTWYDGAPWDDGHEVDLEFVKTCPASEVPSLKEKF